MIEFINVTKRYKSNKALSNVNFTIKENDVVLFVGENGSGKSTCLKLINNIINLNKYDEGQIINEFKSISYLPEKFTFPSLVKTKDYIKIYQKIYNVKIDVNKLMNDYKIPNKLISNLSKGMRQKLGIIITLLAPASLYLFDEPTDGLDIDSKKIFMDDIKELVSQGKTVLISTHNKNFFKEIKTKIFTFEGGKVCKKNQTLRKDT